ncbi:MAG TPA: ABC transporter permease [Nanoarchaeota archaeon]|nr:ABC transporter permease [Nanoarchaeota archaeon]
MISDYISLSVSSFRARKLRAGLTLLGVIIGVALLVTLVSLGQGLRGSITAQFQTLGTDKVFVYPGSNIFSVFSGGGIFTEYELGLVKKTAGVKLAAAMIQKLGRVKSDNEVKYTWVSGIPLDESRDAFKSVHNMDVVSGRDLKNGDKEKAVIGISLTKDKIVFTKGLAAGSKIMIEGVPFDVVGTLGSMGNPDDDSQVMIPLETAKALFNAEDAYSFILAQVQPGVSPAKSAEAIKKKLRSYRDLEEGDENFSVQTMDDMLASFDTILAVVEAVVIGLAMISLIVGAIGIMNSMYTSILERTRQIGVMKAIGAKNSDIALIFIIESGVLGLVGGIIGIAAGFGIAKLIEMGAHMAGVGMFNVYLQWWLPAGAMAFSLLIGILSGLLPALQAAKLKPVDALRYE